MQPPRSIASLTVAVGVVLAAPQAARAGGLPGFSQVAPPSIDLVLQTGQTATLPASITVLPFCFVPIDVDVVASDPSAAFINLDGVQTNGCGGDTTSFDIQFTGLSNPQHYDLLFVDAALPDGSSLGSIPVSIVPEPSSLLLLGAGLVAVCQSSRRPTDRRSAASAADEP